MKSKSKLRTFKFTTISSFIIYLIGGLHFGLYFQSSFLLIIVSGLLILTSIAGLFLIKVKLSVKLKWMFLILVLITLCVFVRPYQYKISYLTYIKVYEKELKELIQLANEHEGEFTIYPDNSTIGDEELTQLEKSKISSLKKPLKYYMIQKDKMGLYIGLWGFNNTRLGLYYSLDGNFPRNTLICCHLKGKWFYN